MEAQWPRERMPGSHQPPISARRPSSPTSSAVAAWMWPASSPSRVVRSSTSVRITEGPSPEGWVGAEDMRTTLANTCTLHKHLFVIFRCNSVAKTGRSARLREHSAQELRAGPCRHVGLREPLPGLVHREQPPVETVLDHVLEVCRLDLGGEVEQRAQRGRARDAIDGRDVARGDVVVADDRLLATEPPSLGQDTIPVDEQRLAPTVQLVLVGPVLVEPATARHHLGAAHRAALHVAARVVVAAARDAAVVAPQAQGPRAGFGAESDHLDGPTVEMEHADRARTGRRHLLLTPATDRHHTTSVTTEWATFPAVQGEPPGSNTSGMVPPHGRNEERSPGHGDPLEEAYASSDPRAHATQTSATPGIWTKATARRAAWSQVVGPRGVKRATRSTMRSLHSSRSTAGRSIADTNTDPRTSMVTNRATADGWRRPSTLPSRWPARSSSANRLSRSANWEMSSAATSGWRLAATIASTSSEPSSGSRWARATPRSRSRSAMTLPVPP